MWKPLVPVVALIPPISSATAILKLQQFVAAVLFFGLAFVCSNQYVGATIRPSAQAQSVHCVHSPHLKSKLVLNGTVLQRLKAYPFTALRTEL